MSSVYDQKFYDDQMGGSLLSASIILPHLESIFPGIRSVVDVGCGGGTWLSYFANKGVRILGIDGNLLPPEEMMIPAESYRRQNLEESATASEKFDLCMCLEVAEHLSSARAPSLAKDLCNLSDIVLFGAAIPGQDGTHHINCQWQSYWIDLFEQRGFMVFDLVRPIFWNDSRVEWWYLQNTLVFVRASRTDLTKASQDYQEQHKTDGLVDVVHPRALAVHHYLNPRNSPEPSARAALRLARKALIRSIKNRLRSRS